MLVYEVCDNSSVYLPGIIHKPYRIQPLMVSTYKLSRGVIQVVFSGTFSRNISGHIWWNGFLLMDFIVISLEMICLLVYYQHDRNYRVIL